MEAHLYDPMVSVEAGVGVHVLFEVQIQVLEHQIEPLFAVDHIVKPEGMSCSSADRMHASDEALDMQHPALLSWI